MEIQILQRFVENIINLALTVKKYFYFFVAPGQTNNLRSFGIEIQNIEAADHGVWSVSVFLKDESKAETLNFHITVALPPNEIRLESNSLQVS